MPDFLIVFQGLSRSLVCPSALETPSLQAQYATGTFACQSLTEEMGVCTSLHTGSGAEIALSLFWVTSCHGARFRDLSIFFSIILTL